MKAFARLSLLSLLFAISQNITSANTTITITTPAATTTTAAPAATTTTAAPAATTTTAAPAATTTTAAPAATTTTAAPAATTTTAAPAATTTTAAPAATTTTAAPAATTTTAAPAATTTTAAPAATTTTAAPAATTTTAAPAATTTTAAPAATTTTAAPAATTTTAAPAATTTTAAPAATTTTAAPAATTTTAAPAATTTTAAPAATTTTAAPAATTTTAAPAATTTTAAPAATTTTAAPAATTTTAAPVATTTTAAPAATTSTTIAPTSSSVISPDPCKDDPCSGGASCVGLNNSYFCLCIDGYYYNSSTCKKGKVFPGTIKVNVSETSGLEDEKSMAYKNLYVEIIKFFEGAFTNLDFGQTVIHKVRIPASARSEMRAGNKLVDVTVVNLFAENTKENETTISNAIDKAVANNRNTFSDYTTQDRCDFYGCEKAQDDCRDVLQCKCKPGLSRPNPQTALCLTLGPKCPDNCNAEHNMQCLVRNGESPDCVCLPGHQKDAQGSCQACPFGYSGVNCEDEFQLILTIVGTVAGILILGMVIALIFLRSKKNKGIEEQNLIENDFQSLRLSTTGFSNLGAEGSIFPKVRATFKDSPAQNPYSQNPYSQNPYSQRNMPRPDY